MKKACFFRFSPMKMLLLLVLFTRTGPAFSQEDTAVATTFRNIIESDRWVFTANRSDPSTSRNTGLSSGTEVRCTGDSLIFSLPYAGTMQGPARFPDSNGPLYFTSTDFKITKKKLNKGKWMLTVRIKDQYEVGSCTFTFFENGTAALDVIPINRTPIEFYGTYGPLQ